MGHLILVADGMHNFIGGLTVTSVFFIDHRLGVVAWLAAAAHEVPQELGDFGILVNSGWGRARPCCTTWRPGATFSSAAWWLTACRGVRRGVPGAHRCRQLRLHLGHRPDPWSSTTDPVLRNKVVAMASFAVGLDAIDGTRPSAREARTRQPRRM